MNLFFRISRARILLFSRNNLVSTKEGYEALMKKSIESYTAQPLIIKDGTVHAEPDQSALFCVIEEHRGLGAAYGFPYSADRSDKENALAIMEHLTKHTFYCGATKNLLPDDAAEILKNAFDLPFDKAINCRMKAIALTDILNAYGIKALPVCATSAQNGCHFLVNVWLKEENRFIVMDPSFNCTFLDETGKALSVHELRDHVVNQQSVVVNGYSFLGTEDFKDYYYSAFICDLMANLATWETNRRGKKELSKVCGVKFNARVPESLCTPYVCKIASLEEMNAKWDEEIERHPASQSNWLTWKKEAVRNAESGKSVPYYGVLRGRVICEATAMLHPDAVQNSEGLVDEKTAYLCAFRTVPEYRGQGYFSKLLRFMLDDLAEKGCQRVTLGVEPDDENNLKIYRHFGFTDFIKHGREVYPDATAVDVDYYGKRLPPKNR